MILQLKIFLIIASFLVIIFRYCYTKYVSIREIQYKFFKSKYAISTNTLIRKYMNNSTLLMVGILAAVAMLSATIVVVPIHEASAERDGKDDKDDKDMKDIKDSYDGKDDKDGKDMKTDFNFGQYQKNKCSGSAICTNDAKLIFG